MKKFKILVVLLIVTFCCNTFAFTLNGEDKVLAEAVRIRARAIEKKWGVKFNPKWLSGSFVEFRTFPDDFYDPKDKCITAEYFADEQKIFFPFRIMDEYRYWNDNVPLGDLSPKAIAAGDYFNLAADHELGHMLTDQFSRLYTNNSYYSLEEHNKRTPFDQIGAKMVSEGIGRYFEKLLHPHHKRVPSQSVLPESLEANLDKNLSKIIYDGGEWIVSDILKKFEKRGLIWLVRNHFHPTDDLRQSGKDFRTRALKELSKSR